MKNGKNIVFYIGDFTIPNENVQMQLVLNNGRILSELGYEVIYIGIDETLPYGMQLSTTRICYKGFSCYRLPFKKGLRDLLNHRRYCLDILRLMNEYKGSVYCVISYQAPLLATSLLYISRWCTKNDAYYVTNCADLPIINHGTFLGRLFKQFNWWMMESINKRYSRGVIAVSSYIKDFYRSIKGNCVVIPPLVDTTAFLTPNCDNCCITLVYAGTPFPIDGRKVNGNSYKDRLDIALSTLYNVYSKGVKFKMDIYGLTKEQYLAVIKEHETLLNKCGDIFIFHGKVASDKIKHIIAEADFTINIREQNRMTQAGFSTKFVESISCGTPVITTLTSDLNDYLKEGENGFFLDISDIEKSTEKLTNILSMNRKSINEMKLKCFNSQIFDYRNYKEVMKKFMMELGD